MFKIELDYLVELYIIRYFLILFSIYLVFTIILDTIDIRKLKKAEKVKLKKQELQNLHFDKENKFAKFKEDNDL